MLTIHASPDNDGQRSDPPINRVIPSTLHAASQSLYDVAIRPLEINVLVQRALNPSSEAALSFDVLVALAKLAVDRAEGAR